MRLEGKTAIVTGASGGMGGAIARLFAREGARLLLGDIHPPGDLVEDLEAMGADVLFQSLDVTREEDWTSAVSAALDSFGAVNILVNNAGRSGAASPDLTNIDAWQRLMDVNAKGVFLGMRAVIDVMTRSGGGSIVNVSSVAAMVGMPYVHMGYSASKAAARLATKAAAVQHGPAGIRVNSIHPGMMPPMRETAKASHVDPSVRQALFEAIPLRRQGRVEEVAAAVLFLASDEASYITGTELVVDGGWLAGV